MHKLNLVLIDNIIKMTLFFVIVLALLSLTYSEKTINSTCEQYELPNFENVSQPNGSWYGLSSYEDNKTCISVTFNETKNSTLNFTLAYKDDAFHQENVNNNSWKIIVLKENLTVLWSCEDFVNSSRQNVYILVKNASADYKQTIQNVLNRTNIVKEEHLIPTNQSASICAKSPANVTNPSEATTIKATTIAINSNQTTAAITTSVTTPDSPGKSSPMSTASLILTVILILLLQDA